MDSIEITYTIVHHVRRIDDTRTTHLGAYQERLQVGDQIAANAVVSWHHQHNEISDAQQRYEYQQCFGRLLVLARFGRIRWPQFDNQHLNDTLLDITIIVI